jgi:hypothetical protein
VYGRAAGYFHQVHGCDGVGSHHYNFVLRECYLVLPIGNPMAASGCIVMPYGSPLFCILIYTQTSRIIVYRSKVPQMLQNSHRHDATTSSQPRVLGLVTSSAAAKKEGCVTDPFDGAQKIS